MNNQRLEKNDLFCEDELQIQDQYDRSAYVAPVMYLYFIQYPCERIVKDYYNGYVSRK